MKWLAIALAATIAAAQAEVPPGHVADELQPIVVTATRRWVENLIDRQVYDVSSDLQASFGTASDLLSTIPSVDVDADGAVSLRGDNNVLILIDGKPSALFKGSSAGDNLQTLPAGDIERIEVMTNPPPEYKAEGVAGVINIVMRRKHPAGISGSVQAGLGTEGRHSLGVSGSYATSSLSAAISATYRYDRKDRQLISDLVGPQMPDGAVVDSRSSMSESLRRTVPPIDASLSYALDDRDSLRVEGFRTGRAGPRDYNQFDETLPPASTPTQIVERQSAGHQDAVEDDEKLEYERQLEREGEQLSVRLHRSSSHDVETYEYTTTPLLPAASLSYSNLGFSENSATTEASADYVLPVEAGGSLKLGYEFEHDVYSFSAAGASVGAVSGVQTPDPYLTDVFTYREDIQAAYASYQATAGAWTGLGGMRAEWFQARGQQYTQALVNEYRYVRAYPSLHLERRISAQAVLTLGASRRVTRPDADLLNPYIDYEYRPNLRSGNAALRPEYTDSLELGFKDQSPGTTVSLTTYYRYNTGSFSDVTENLGNGLSLTTRYNLAIDRAAGLEFALDAHLLRTLTGTLSGNAFYSQIDATPLGFAGTRSTTGLNGKLKLEYRPTTTDSAELIVTRTDRRLTPQGEISAIDVVNAGYRRQISAALKATVTVSDLFDGQRYRRIAVTPTFTDLYQRSWSGRIVWLGVVYTLGASGRPPASQLDYEQPK